MVFRKYIGIVFGYVTWFGMQTLDIDWIFNIDFRYFVLRIDTLVVI